MIEMLQSKIHRAVVTDANVNYEGSITLSAKFIKKVGIKQYQRVLVVDVNNGNRFETYVIESTKENEVCVNGAAAHLVNPGDRVIIMAFGYFDNCPEDYKPRVILLDEHNGVINEY